MREVGERVFFVGVQDRISEYFDQLMPLSQGTSYNSYLIKGTEKTALIDTVDPRFADELIEHVKEIGIERIDYIIANHAEQDHTGALPRMLELHTDAKIVCNEKCRGFIQEEHHLPEERFLIIRDKEELSLGDKTLRFLFAPWVHWPETMFTHLKEDNILFTCDLFGAHLASDELYAKEGDYESAAKRYYAEIMMPFAKVVARYTTMIKELQPAMIAPSHGPMHDEPEKILRLHEEWTSGRTEKRVVICYVSMHGSTKRMAEHLVWKCKEQGIPAEMYDLMQAEIGKITMDLIGAETLVIASPAYLGGLHPAAANFLFLINGFKPPIKRCGFISSNGWGDHGGYEQAKEQLHHLNAEWFAPIIIQGHPGNDDFKSIDKLVEEIKNT